ncbi:hypothetical protein DV735_g4206, partial [Chaetothyriales sp. CBS 134920]
MADGHITTLISALPPDQPFFSLEFFPPKTQAGFTNLRSRLSRMATALRPLFVSVTWGAGGSTASKSIELAEVCQCQLGLPTVLHLTCTNMKKKTIDEALAACKSRGIRNILALRGDPPRADDYRESDDDDDNDVDNAENHKFAWAVDLIRYIRQKHGDYFCIGCAGYPEGFPPETQALHPPKQSPEHDLPYLADKVEAGAQFVVCQFTYDFESYARYESLVREYTHHNGKKVLQNIPMLPGIMPIQNYSMLKRICKLTHVALPADLVAKLEKVKHDDDAVKNIGVQVLADLVNGIRDLPSHNLDRGFHFYTLNLEKSCVSILDQAKLIPPLREATPPESSSDSEVLTDGPASTHQQQHQHFSRRRASSINAQAHNRVIISSPTTDTNTNTDPSTALPKSQHEAPARGAGIPASDPTREQELLISKGHGSLGREATWDDFPNGRWGPAHSPAYGEIDGYGPSLKVGPLTARKLWGHPKSADDITNLFQRHVLGQLEAIPWSDEIDGDEAGAPGAGVLRAETRVIRDELLALIGKKHYWTLASQPAVDGIRSDDPTFGWGPQRDGFVFQKPFVEFFCLEDEWANNLKPRLQRFPPEKVSWMKVDASGSYESSSEISSTFGPVSSKTSRDNARGNTVTWGVFPGKEIVTPTFIESESFRAWSDEAFAIWAEWRRCFPRGSDEEKFLERMRQNSVLVNVVGHDYIGGASGGGKKLWEILLAD